MKISQDFTKEFAVLDDTHLYRLLDLYLTEKGTWDILRTNFFTESTDDTLKSLELVKYKETSLNKNNIKYSLTVLTKKGENFILNMTSDTKLSILSKVLQDYLPPIHYSPILNNFIGNILRELPLEDFPIYLVSDIEVLRKLSRRAYDKRTDINYVERFKAKAETMKKRKGEYMRLWMVDPKIMCKQHLLGEHVEVHMFVGSILKKKSLNGYIANNLLEPKSLISRHEELVAEMTNRNMNHKSELPDFDLDYLLDNIKNYKIDREKSLADLVNRCPTCRANCELYE